MKTRTKTKKSKPSVQTILSVQTSVMKSMQDFLVSKGLNQAMPVILSPITDPLNHSVYDASIKYKGQELQLTKSMILHKQLLVSKPGVSGIFVFSPNVRLETDELKSSGRHLLEFTQLDIELRDKSSEEFRDLMEDLIIHVFKTVKKECFKELREMSVDLKIPSKPFKVFESKDLKKEYGKDWERKKSLEMSEPFWVLDHKREFYDKEHPKKSGYYINYDLVYPFGFGEALSGGERDYEYDTLVRKIRERDQELESFDYYLKKSKEGKILPSSGGGIGIERLVRFITKTEHVKDSTIFPKIPGKKVEI